MAKKINKKTSTAVGKGNGPGERKKETRGRKPRDPERTFKNLLEVFEYLDSEGWKIGKTQIYEHGRTGKIRPDAGNKYSMKSVLNYAKTHLTTKQTRQHVKDEELQRKKALREVEALELEIKQKKWKQDIAEGKYVPREDLEMELAGRAAVLETGLKGAVQVRAGEWVTLVEGNERKTAMLVRDIIEVLDGALNEYASKMEFQVVLESQQGEQD